MARKLRTFITSIGFYDLAVAAPSMKAALEAWGASQNLFHQGLAQQTDDPDIVTAAMAQPGIVLRRAVGTRDAFQEHARPPRTIAGNAPRTPAAARKTAPRKRAAEPDDKAQKAAVIQFEAVKARRAREREREDARLAKEQAATEADAVRRQKAVTKIAKTLDRARARHDAALEKLDLQRAALDARVTAEREQWKRTEEALRRRIRETET